MVKLSKERYVMKKTDMGGSTYMVLVDGEYAGWFNIAGSSTDVLRAGLSSNPQIIDMEDLEIDLSDLPRGGTDYFWNGVTFEKKDING
jgi:hypothetical protein